MALHPHVSTVGGPFYVHGTGRKSQGYAGQRDPGYEVHRIARMGTEASGCVARSAA